MIWGYGPAGYGPWRTAEILRQYGAEERLSSVVRITRDRDPLAGYDALSSRECCRLLGLGPAFGTKFLSFAALNQPAPVLDALVSRWLFKHSGGAIALGNRGWRTDHYEAYVDLMQRLTTSPIDDIKDSEYLIFADAAVHLSKRPERWRESWVPTQ